MNGIRPIQMYFLIQGKPEFGNDGRIAPVRNATFWIRNQICAPAGTAVHIAGEDKALFLREIGIVIAQVEIDVFLRERYARVPIQICRQWKAARAQPTDCRTKNSRRRR